MNIEYMILMPIYDINDIIEYRIYDLKDRLYSCYYYVANV